MLLALPGASSDSFMTHYYKINLNVIVTGMKFY